MLTYVACWLAFYAGLHYMPTLAHLQQVEASQKRGIPLILTLGLKMRDVLWALRPVLLDRGLIDQGPGLGHPVRTVRCHSVLRTYI